MTGALVLYSGCGMGGGGGGGGHREDWRCADCRGAGGGVSSRPGTGECARMALTAMSARNGDTQRWAPLMGDTERLGRGTDGCWPAGRGMYGSSLGGSWGCKRGGACSIGGICLWAGASSGGGAGDGTLPRAERGAAGSDTRRKGLGLGGWIRPGHGVDLQGVDLHGCSFSTVC